jgi:hypothetical protein
MTYEEILKYGEIQYLKGRLDELNKTYMPGLISTDNRVVDYRISKYEEKLKNTDEISFYLYQTELKNRNYSKEKSKKNIKKLLEDIISHVNDKGIIERIEKQINSY